MLVYTVATHEAKARRWKAPNHRNRFPNLKPHETFIAYPSKRDSVPENIGFVQKCAHQWVYRKKRKDQEEYEVQTIDLPRQVAPDVISLDERCVVVHRKK